MSKVRKAVIIAAGRGTRQLFPLVDRDGLTKPVIQIIGEEAIDSGIEQICIVTTSGEEKRYREYFRRLDDATRGSLHGSDWAMLQSEKMEAFGQRLSFAEQSTPEDFGHALFQARGFVGDEPFLLLSGDHVYISDTIERCARQLIRVYDEYGGDAVSGVQPMVERLLHRFAVIRGQPIDPARGIYKAELIIERPSLEVARQKLITPMLPAGNYLADFGMHVFSPRIFEGLEHLIQNDIREKGEFRLTAAQEHLRQQGGDYWCVVSKGQRFDIGVPYGLMETQLALALNGIHRAEACESIARILATQIKS
ncbi:MAG TPA: sugar phosphate nucleotidyltransferase [Tepidisphaeraceae bacterium]|jgi:UTP--glucose-1-phosphate uridylyltransferase